MPWPTCLCARMQVPFACGARTCDYLGSKHHCNVDLLRRVVHEAHSPLDAHSYNRYTLINPILKVRSGQRMKPARTQRRPSRMQSKDGSPHATHCAWRMRQDNGAADGRCPCTSGSKAQARHTQASSRELHWDLRSPVPVLLGMIYSVP